MANGHKSFYIYLRVGGGGGWGYKGAHKRPSTVVPPIRGGQKRRLGHGNCAEQVGVKRQIVFLASSEGDRETKSGYVSSCRR